MATPTELLQKLKAGEYSPLYFLHGEESFGIDLVSDYIEEHGLTEAEKGFNLSVMYGKDVSLRQVLESARRFPMMAQRQVVIVKEAQELAELKKKDGQTALARYAQSPVPSTVLVFAHKHKKIDGRSEMAKALAKHAHLIESKKLYDNQVPSWIKSYCTGRGWPIQEKAVRLLSEYIGNNLSRIAKEIDKLLIGYPQGKEITEEIVARQVGMSKEYNVFELQTALAHRNVLKANQILKYFEADPKGHPLIPMISMLYNYFSKVLLIHHNSGKNAKELASILKVNPYFMKEYQVAARNYPLAKTVRAIELLHKTDLGAKGVDRNASDIALLKEFVYRVLHL